MLTLLIIHSITWLICVILMLIAAMHKGPARTTPKGIGAFEIVLGTLTAVIPFSFPLLIIVVLIAKID